VVSATWVANWILLQVQIPDGQSAFAYLSTVTASSGIDATIRTGGSTALVEVMAQGGVWPDDVDVYLTFMCDGIGTVRYQVGVRLFTGNPGSGDVRYLLLDDDADAGT
jgi:hypothetical protein